MKVRRYILESYNKAKKVISSCQSFDHKRSARRYVDNFVKLYSPNDEKEDTMVRLMYKQLKRDLRNKRI
jgi:hypothetical protein